MPKDNRQLQVDKTMKEPVKRVTVHLIVTEHRVGTYTARVDYELTQENADGINVFECILEEIEKMAGKKARTHVL